MSTTGSLEQVNKTKLRLMATIEDSSTVDFNWLKFLVNYIVDQKKCLTYAKGSLTQSSKILYGTNIGYLIESLREEMESSISTKVFQKNKIMLKDAKGRSQKRKKDKASKSSTAEEHVDVEAEGEPISSPKDVPAKRLRKEFAKKA